MAAESPIRVLIADDHDLFRVGVASMLADSVDVEVVGQASGGKMAVRLARELRPDVVLMDLRMPDLDGPDATRAILECEPSTRVIALTVAADAADVEDAMLAGASGYLLKDAPIEHVLSAIRAAAHGAAWLSPRAADAVFDGFRQRQAGTVPASRAEQQLSPRELEVLRLVAAGLDNGAIADRLCISQRTAKNHVASILEKLGFSNRIEAATYAVRRGLA